MVTQRSKVQGGAHNKDVLIYLLISQLVNFSVRAQDMILKATQNGFKTTDDLNVNGFYTAKVANNSTSYGLGGVTTNISQDMPIDLSKHFNLLNRSVIQENGGPDGLLLPSIKSSVRKNQQSPFKANHMDLASGGRVRQAPTDNRGGSAIKGPYQPDGVGSLLKEDFRGSHSVDKRMQVKMNPKVLETWINETLQDAEHLDIPGVILKPEHKNPISRYGIDRLALTNAGIPNEMVDRIFRALFVYSVGFYELIKKCLQHTEKKYTIITAIWKVFSILLEYCCKTDYRMLISEISKEHKDELDKLEKEFQQKFTEQAHNEKILKQNMEILQKYNEELEKERTNERQMRLKLEEEYMQNTKNHEEEVQLRLKFESKLNNMHSVHRDLETKYKRALNEMATLQNSNEQLTNKNNHFQDEITQLKTIKAENESRISYNEEKLASLQREINIKIRQVEDYEQRYTKTQDDLDLTKYKLQESHKDITELRLKIDVYESQVTGLKNERQHLQLELKETKDLQKIYETKCNGLMDKINKINVEYQDSKREIIGFGEIQKEREDRIEKLKKELREIKNMHEELDLKHGTLNIQHEKVREQYDTSKKDLDEAIEKLHVTNKVRHETEVKLHEEEDKNRTLQEIIRDKEEQLGKRTAEIEELDKKVIEIERINEALEIKKAGIERQYELTKKQLNEKVQNLNDVLQSEKETREMWIERYEKEQKDHTTTNAQLLSSKSQHKDQILQTKNAEIKIQTLSKANEVLSDSNNRLQDHLNESLAKCENLEREINTQKEIMKQMDISRKEYINKLKRELETVESRFTQQMDRNAMLSEEYYSRAAHNLLNFQLCKFKLDEIVDTLNDTKIQLQTKIDHIEQLDTEIRRYEMQSEDYEMQNFNQKEKTRELDNILQLVKTKCEQLEITNKQLKIDADQKLRYQYEMNDMLKQLNHMKKEAKDKKDKDHNTTSISFQDKVSVQVQTMMTGQNLDGLVQQQNYDNQNQSSKVRVGGGGEIRKPSLDNKQRVDPKQFKTQQQQLSIGGQTPSGRSNQNQQQLQTQGSNQQQQLIQNNNKKLSTISNNQQSNQKLVTNQTMSNQNSNHGSNATLSQGGTISRGIELENKTPTNGNVKQIIQGVYPQTATNQQKNQLQFQINTTQREGQGDAQMTSPRNNQRSQADNNYFSTNKGFAGGGNDLSSNNDETLATKRSPHPQFQNQLINSQQDFDVTNTLPSLMQSPQGTLNPNRQNRQAPYIPQQQSVNMMESSQISGNNVPGDYQTIQSQPYQYQNQDDPSQQYMQQPGYQAYNEDQIIHEDDEEEERKTPGMQFRNHSNSNGNDVRQSTGQQSVRNPSNKRVEYKNMNTVLQNQSSKIIANGEGSNKSRPSDQNYNNVQVKKQSTNKLNNLQGQFQNDYLQQQQKAQISHQVSESQLQDLDEIQAKYQSNSQLNQQQYYQYQQQQQQDNQIDYNDYEEKDISRQNEESLAPESIMNQSIYNQNMNQQVATTSRMKIDITNSQQLRGVAGQQQQTNQGNPNNNYINSGLAQMQSPTSQNSSFSNNLNANRFGLPPMNLQFQQQQQNNQGYDNKKVSGKTSIRTLIKSAATREHH